MASEDHMFSQEHGCYAFQQESSQLPPNEQATLPLLALHQALEKAGAYKKIQKEKHRQVLQAYLTTETPMGDLQDLAGVKTPRGVNDIIHSTMQKVFPHLPQKVQEEYISPKAAIRRKSGILAPISRERQKERGGRPKGKKDSQPR